MKNSHSFTICISYLCDKMGTVGCSRFDLFRLRQAHRQIVRWDGRKEMCLCDRCDYAMHLRRWTKESQIWTSFYGQFMIGIGYYLTCSPALRTFPRSAGRDSCAANKIIDVMRGTRAQNQSVFGDSQRFQMPITRRQKSKSESCLAWTVITVSCLEGVSAPKAIAFCYVLCDDRQICLEGEK